MTADAAMHAPVSGWTILCDFDGTITVEDVTDSLLERYGRPGWQALEQDWRAGLIGSGECMARQVGLLEVSREQLDAHLSALSIDPAFPAFVAEARRMGLPIRVVSDGLDYAIWHILARHGLDDLPLAANHLVAAALPGRWQLASPFQAAGCSSGTCKCACAGQGRGGGVARTVLIGDGASDFCVAGRVDLVFAKPRLLDHCRAAGIPCIAISGFGDALHYLPRLLGGTLPDGASPVRATFPPDFATVDTP